MRRPSRRPKHTAKSHPIVRRWPAACAMESLEWLPEPGREARPGSEAGPLLPPTVITRCEWRRMGETMLESDLEVRDGLGMDGMSTVTRFVVGGAGKESLKTGKVDCHLRRTHDSPVLPDDVSRFNFFKRHDRPLP